MLDEPDLQILCTYRFWVCFKTAVDKLFEILAEISSERGRLELCDHEEGPRCLEAGIRRLSSGDFNGGHSQTPNVGLKVIESLRSTLFGPQRSTCMHSFKPPA